MKGNETRKGFTILLPSEVIEFDFFAQNISSVSPVELRRERVCPLFVFPFAALLTWLLYSIVQLIGDRPEYFIYTLLSIVIIAILDRSWLNDDVFVTFRYVENFLKGFGISYNPGLRSEGFSHPLWFALLSFLHSFKIPLTTSTFILSYSFIGLTLWLAARNELLTFLLPFFFTTWGAIIFSTSGFETPLSFFLIILIFIFLTKNREKSLLFGLLVGLLGIHRIDFLVYTAFLIFYTWRKNGRESRISLAAALSLLMAFQLFRMGYFAELLPNSAIAKLFVPTHVKMGFNYLMDFVKVSNLLLLLFISILIFKSKHDFLKIIVSASLLHILITVERGGGYMHSRLLLPDYFSLALASSFYIQKAKFPEKLKKVLILFAAFYPIISHILVPHWNTSRNSYYPLNKSGLYFSNLFSEEVDHPWYIQGKNLKYLAENLKRPLKVEVQGTGMLGFAAGERVWIVDYYGLTDPIVARVKVKYRWRPGHEKFVPNQYRILLKLDLISYPTVKEWIDFSITPYGYLFYLTKWGQTRLLKKELRAMRRKLCARISLLVKKKNKSSKDLKEIWIANLILPAGIKSCGIKTENITNPYEKWFRKNQSLIKLILKRKTVRLNLKEFIKNIYYSFKFFSISFSGEKVVKNPLTSSEKAP